MNKQMHSILSAVTAAGFCLSGRLGAGYATGLSATQKAAADVNGDGAIDAGDAASILQYAAYCGAGGTERIEAFLKENQT